MLLAEAAAMRVIRHRRQAYPASVAEQERMVARILRDESPPSLILTEHPPVYTIGTSGGTGDILETEMEGGHIDVYSSGRGGEVTYHGPGQLVCYVLADLRREQDLHKHVWRLEEMIIRCLAEFSLAGKRSSKGIGVWVGGAKIAAVGVRCRRWVTYHGAALNIAPNLRHFDGIIACGLQGERVTSMREMGVTASRAEVEAALLPHAQSLFGASFNPGS